MFLPGSAADFRDFHFLSLRRDLGSSKSSCSPFTSELGISAELTGGTVLFPNPSSPIPIFCRSLAFFLPLFVDISKSSTVASCVRSPKRFSSGFMSTTSLDEIGLSCISDLVTSGVLTRGTTLSADSSSAYSILRRSFVFFLLFLVGISKSSIVASFATSFTRSLSSATSLNNVVSFISNLFASEGLDEGEILSAAPSSANSIFRLSFAFFLFLDFFVINSSSSAAASVTTTPGTKLSDSVSTAFLSSFPFPDGFGIFSASSGAAPESGICSLLSDLLLPFFDLRFDLRDVSSEIWSGPASRGSSTAGLSRYVLFLFEGSSTWYAFSLSIENLSKKGTGLDSPGREWKLSSFSGAICSLGKSATVDLSADDIPSDTR